MRDTAGTMSFKLHEVRKSPWSFHTAVIAARSLAVDTAPKMPPSSFKLSTVARCKASALAAQHSSTNKQSKPRSLASRIVVLTQTSVVTPTKARFRTPLTLNNNSKSVLAKAPFPGFSITGSPILGYSSGMVSWPGSPRTRRRPRDPSSPMPKPEALLRERKSSREESVERSARWPSRVW